MIEREREREREREIKVERGNEESIESDITKNSRKLKEIKGDSKKFLRSF